MEESITHKSKYEKREVISEETIIASDMKKNTSVEVMNGKEIVLSPLSPKKVYEDQMIMRERMCTWERKRKECVAKGEMWNNK